MLLGLIDKLSGEKTRLLGLIHATALEKEKKKTCLPGAIHKLSGREHICWD